MKSAFREKTFFVTFTARPTNDTLFIMRSDVGVIVCHLSVTNGAACGLERRFRVISDLVHGCSLVERSLVFNALAPQQANPLRKKVLVGNRIEVACHIALELCAAPARNTLIIGYEPQFIRIRWNG